MNTLEKLQYCKNNGLSITFIAKEVGLSPATLTKWLRGEKGITHKNEKLTELTLQNIVKRLYENIVILMIGIYKIENLINGKVYIGQSVDIKGRWNEHKLVNSRASKDALKRQKYPLYLAFEKYGLDNFSFEVIEECPVEELNEKEQFYIKKYNSYIDFPNSNGYNLTLGGDGTRKVTEEQILNILKLWDEGKTTGEIMDILQIEKHAIIKYLKLFSSTYSVEESDFRGRINAGISHRKKIDCYDLWEII